MTPEGRVACAYQQEADYPPGLELKRTFSGRIEALVCYLHHSQRVSYRGLQRLMEHVFGLAISQGTLTALTSALAACPA